MTSDCLNCQSLLIAIETKQNESKKTGGVTTLPSSTGGSGAGRRGIRSLPLEERSPTFLAPGTSYVEDNFSTGWGGGRVCSGGNRSDGSGSNVSDGEQQMKLCLSPAHLLLCGPVSNRPWTHTGLRPRGWGPLL